MYTIQKYKAKEYVLKIGGNQVTTLEDIRWVHLKGYGRLMRDILHIYGIHNKYNENTATIHFPSSHGEISFYFRRIIGDGPFLNITTSCGGSLNINTPNNNNGGMLLFLVDPLQVINELDHKEKHIVIKHFLDYYRDTIIDQDRELLHKYILMRHLVNEFAIIDIIHAIVDNIVHIFL